VRRIFAGRAAGTTIRQICRQLNADAVPTPTGSRAVWGTSTLDRILRNEAYIGRTYFNRTEAVPARRPGHHSRQVPRPRADWIAIGCPAIVADDMFEAAGKVSTDNTKWNPRRAEPGAWLLRGLVKCGPCGVGTSCHKMRGRNGTWHRYYYCHNHDPLRAGGQDRRCPERNIRADALDEFVFGQVRAALLDPALLLAGEQATAVHAPVPDDQLLAAELARLDRKLDAARGEHRRLVDLYQAGLIDMPELQRRATAITARQRELKHKRASLAAERADLAHGNRLRHGVESFATRVRAVIDQLDPAQQQKLLRLLIEDVQVTGWHVKIRLRIPLDDPPDGDHTHRRTPPPGPATASSGTPPVSTENRLRSLHAQRMRQMHLRPRGRQRVRSPVPPIRRLEHHLRALPGPGDLPAQFWRAVGDPGGLQPPAILSHPDQHRPSAVQVHPDDLPAVVCFRHRGPPCLVETDALQLPASARSGGPLLHRIRGFPHRPDSGGMGQQMPQRRRPKARLGGNQPVGAQVVAGGRVEVNLSLFPQLHDGDRGDGLGDRVDPEDCVLVDRRARLDVGDAVPMEPRQGSVADHPHRQAGDGPAVENPGDPGLQPGLVD
jgi:Recombinase/Recombinase zinc beta ribbon domain